MVAHRTEGQARPNGRPSRPRSSGTIAVPIVVNGRVLATVGMTYFTSALYRTDVVQRYVPLVKTLADNIAASVSSLQQ
jgi:IclR family transcriptional regulator, mhp operon transcriptional activator